MAVGKISLGILLRYLLALMLALVVLIPLVMTVFGGLKSTGDLLSNPIGWPAGSDSSTAIRRRAS